MTSPQQPDLNYLNDLSARLVEGDRDKLHFYDFTQSGSAFPLHTIIIANIPDDIYRKSSDHLESQPRGPRDQVSDIGFVLCQIIAKGDVRMKADVQSGAKGHTRQGSPPTEPVVSRGNPTVGDTINCYFDSGEVFATIATIINQQAVMVLKSGGNATFFTVHIDDIHHGDGDVLIWGIQ